MKVLLIDTSDRKFSFLKYEGLDTVSFPKPGYEATDGSFSFDLFISINFIKPVLSKVEFDLLIIPYSLTDNFLELTGLRLGHHVRLTEALGAKRLVPIVFVGNESPYLISKLSPLANILHTQGSYWTPLDPASVLKLKFSNLTGLVNQQEFLSRLQIEPPENYSSHHSVANELALLRWSEFVGCDDDIPEVRNNIQSGLYFKFFNVLKPVQNKQTHQPWFFEGKAKIVLIDDEADKGWSVFYSYLFQDTEIDFKSLPVKTGGRESIVRNSIDQIALEEPDVILLDLRLSDEDFNPKCSPKNLTGVKILEAIKENNKGIQVIIITASNKIWNYESTLEIGANGYIIKRMDSTVEDDIENLISVLSKGIFKSSHLKPINLNFDKLTAQLKDNLDFSEKFKNSVNNNLQVIFRLLEESFRNEKYRNYAYLQLFLLIEEFLQEDKVFSYGDSCYVDSKILIARSLIDNKSKIFESIITGDKRSVYRIKTGEFSRPIDTHFKMAAVLIFRYGLETSKEKNWHLIRDIRNKKAAHPGKERIQWKEINILIDFLIFLFDTNNKKIRSLKEGLKEIPIEDKLKMLQTKFNKK